MSKRGGKMRPWTILALGVGIIVLIIFLLIIVNPKPEVSNLILTGVNLFLVLGYVVATLNMVRVNEDMMEMTKISTNLMKSPVISANVGSLVQKKQQQQEEQQQEEVEEVGDDNDEHKRINEIFLLLENKTNNYARDVKVTVRAFVNNSEYIGSYPINGEKDFYVQAGYKVYRKIKMQEEFLNRAELSIKRMSELANESNRETQFVLKVKISHSDGFGKKIELPELSWYFDFMGKAWNFIG